MLNKLSERILKSKIKKDNALRSRAFLPWDKIDKIALIISNEEALNKSAIDKYLERTKKYVEVFHIELKSKEPTYNDWECFAKKDKSVLKFPKNNKLNKLKSKHFDLVINACPQDELFSTALASTLNAPLKCGSGSRFNDCDLIIKRTERTELLKYLDDVTHYLKMIKS